MFTKMAHEAFMKLKQVRRRSWGGGLPYIYIYIYIFGYLMPPSGPKYILGRYLDFLGHPDVALMPMESLKLDLLKAIPPCQQSTGAKPCQTLIRYYVSVYIYIYIFVYIYRHTHPSTPLEGVLPEPCFKKLGFIGGCRLLPSFGRCLGCRSRGERRIRGRKA